GRYKISKSSFSDLGSSGTGRMSAPRPFPSQSQHTRVPHPVLFSCPWSLSMFRLSFGLRDSKGLVVDLNRSFGPPTHHGSNAIPCFVVPWFAQVVLLAS